MKRQNGPMPLGWALVFCKLVTSSVAHGVESKVILDSHPHTYSTHQLEGKGHFLSGQFISIVSTYEGLKSWMEPESWSWSGLVEKEQDRREHASASRPQLIQSTESSLSQDGEPGQAPEETNEGRGFPSGAARSEGMPSEPSSPAPPGPVSETPVQSSDNGVPHSGPSQGDAPELGLSIQERIDVFSKVTVTSHGGGRVRFEPRRIVVQAGQLVELTLTNEVSQGAYNWVLVKPGRVNEVLAMGLDSGVDPGGIFFDPDILAHTGRVRQRQSVSVLFLAPDEPGEYTFLSTLSVTSGVSPQAQKQLVPRGTLIVVPIPER